MRPGWLDGGLVVALLLVSPWIAAVWTGSGDWIYDQSAMPLVLLGLGGVLALAVLVAQHDPWLAVGLTYVAIQIHLRPTLLAMATLEAVVNGALLLLLVWHAAAALGPLAHRWAVGVLGLGALLQVGYAGLQRFGSDPIWVGLKSVSMPGVGSLGSSGALGAYLGILTPLLPLAIVPLGLLGVALSGSLVGALAAGVGLAVRYRHRLCASRCLVGVVAAGLSLTGMLIAWLHWSVPASLAWRSSVWSLGVSEWSAAPIFGHGFGAWTARMPRLYAAALGRPQTYGELPTHAHNELVQLLYEGGAVALGLLGAWLYRHRAIWCGPYAGPLAAGAVVMLGYFPFHVATTALVLLVIIGVATAAPAGGLAEA